MTYAHRSLIRSLGVLLFAATAVFSQTTPRITITGRVLDDSTLVPLENVNVFLAHTTLGSNTDQNGRFEIRNIPVGSYEIVASRVGYAVRSYRVALSDTARQEFSIRLRAKTIQLGEVLVSDVDPVEWRKQLEIFTQLFLGSTQNATQCKILNPEVIDFRAEGSTFNATARAPLEIENLALGYRVEFFLSTFVVGPGIGVQAHVPAPAAKPTGRGFLTLEGLPKYVEIEPSTVEEERRWRGNRVRAFKGSLRHFLISLFRKELKTEGFVLNNGWVTEDDVLGIGQKPNEKIVRFQDELVVAFTREPTDPAFEEASGVRRIRGAVAQVSWLSLNYEAITVNSEGLILERLPTIVHGYWAWERMADALPLDYEPE